MGAQKLRTRRKSTLGCTPWLRLTRTWYLSTLGPLKEASVFVLYALYIDTQKTSTLLISFVFVK